MWTQEAKFTAAAGSAGDFFGRAVSLEGDRAVVGANQDDDRGTNSGAAYVFTRTGSTWAQEAKLVASDGEPSDLFGSSVSISGDRVVIGSFRHDAGGGTTDSGAAYVFAGIGSVAAEEGTPVGVTLSAPSPNPTAGRFTLALTVDEAQSVRAVVYDALGRQVAVAFEGEVAEAVRIAVDTSRLAPGVYVVRVEGATFAEVRRLTVVR